MGRDSLEHEHLTADEVAAYVDRTLSSEARDRVEYHLAYCSECRAEVAVVSDSSNRASGADSRRHWLGVSVAAAAALAAFALWPSSEGTIPVAPGHRDDPALREDIPQPLRPMGAVESVDLFEWQAVSGADRYRITLYEETGVVLWRAETEKSSMALPDSVFLETTRTYLWRVEARTDVDRWIASEMVRFDLFSAGGRDPPDLHGREAIPP